MILIKILNMMMIDDDGWTDTKCDRYKNRSVWLMAYKGGPDAHSTGTFLLCGGISLKARCTFLFARLTSAVSKWSDLLEATRHKARTGQLEFIHTLMKSTHVHCCSMKSHVWSSRTKISSCLWCQPSRCFTLLLFILNIHKLQYMILRCSI